MGAPATLIHADRRKRSLRGVLDTNILVSAFAHRVPGISFQIWEMAINRRYRLLASPALVAEAAGRPSAEFSWEEERVLQRVKLLARLHVVSDDDDKRILECAVAGAAGLIVSSDRHLRKLESYEKSASSRRSIFAVSCHREPNIRDASELAGVGL